MITKEQFIETCKSYGLESEEHIGDCYFMIDGCYLWYYENYEGNIECGGLNPERLYIDDVHGLMKKVMNTDKRLMITTVDELRQNIEDCMKRYRELVKEQRISKIREL